MNRFSFSAIAAVITLSFAMPVSTQAMVHAPAACHIPIQASNGGALAAPTAGVISAGCETTTLPWSAPVGHRQPQAADVQATTINSSMSSIDQALVQENARIDRVIQGVCRGC
jgi:hypothetical protein